ncbi:hypothetical protein NC651_009897 [Populus alba x Populus x berolinensis]|nr:hypothetical protein NC651_009897 [Populus alba x Populus x berolinensis]
MAQKSQRWKNDRELSLDGIPPATTKVSLVKKEASSDAEKATAETMSSVVPSLLSKVGSCYQPL